MEYINIMKSEDERVEYFMKYAPERCRNQELADYLKSKGFFRIPYVAIGTDRPADSLFEHNWNVAHVFRETCKMYACSFEREDSWFIIGMFYNYYLHDCLKELEDGSYMVNLQYFMRADVLASITIAELDRFLHFTEGEKMCFKWHRGMYDYSPDGFQFLRSIHEYPIVYGIQSAEIICSHIPDWSTCVKDSDMIGYRI